MQIINQYSRRTTTTIYDEIGNRHSIVQTIESNKNMKSVQKQTKTVISLFDFATNNAPTSGHSPLRKSATKSSHKGDSLGLSTLLYFNQSDTISSIRSFKKEHFSEEKEESHFGKMMTDAQRQIEELKAKRLELEQHWKLKHKSNFLPKSTEKQTPKLEASSHLSEEADSSLVEQYDSHLFATLYPRKIIASQQEDDLFVIELRQEILRGRLEQFLSHIRKSCLIKLTRQLKMYSKLKEFKEEKLQKWKHDVFAEWKDLIERVSQRKKVRSLVLQRIKRRKKLEELHTDVEVYTANL